jgi:hypothetical protein
MTLMIQLQITQPVYRLSIFLEKGSERLSPCRGTEISGSNRLFFKHQSKVDPSNL